MRELMRAALIFLVLSVVTGLAYPFAITGITRLLFPEKAVGSLVTDRGRVVGSSLIGQRFTQDRYFHGRPSANGYDASNSGGTNFGPDNAKFLAEVARRVGEARRDYGLGEASPVPADLVTASASGLDPHISYDAALLQVPRVARARAMDEAKLKSLVEATAERHFGKTQEKVNVLELNLAVDRLNQGKAS